MKLQVNTGVKRTAFIKGQMQWTNTTMTFTSASPLLPDIIPLPLESQKDLLPQFFVLLVSDLQSFCSISYSALAHICLKVTCLNAHIHSDKKAPFSPQQRREFTKWQLSTVMSCFSNLPPVTTLPTTTGFHTGYSSHRTKERPGLGSYS